MIFFGVYFGIMTLAVLFLWAKTSKYTFKRKIQSNEVG